jgi:adenine-specific DNA-methyltransferase
MPTLDWIGKAAVVNHHRKVPYRLLVCDLSLSTGDTNSGNLLVQGDNLFALKALLPYYAGKVKCIYIDPPYNTGAAFEEYDDGMEHSLWLSMMYPRIELLWEFLTDDGSLWVSLDDNEAHYFKVICDEVFGRDNFVADIAWKKRDGPPNDRVIGAVHEHVLVWGKSRSGNSKKTRAEEGFNLRPRTEKANKEYQVFQEPSGPDPRGPFRKIDTTANGKGGRFVESLFYPITNPYTNEEVWPRKGTCWRHNKEEMARLQIENRLYWGVNGQAKTPMRKLFLSEAKQGMSTPTIWDDVALNQHASREMELLFGEKAAFETPKPEGLLQRIIHIATQPGELVMDCFAGSGTTGAVAHKMGRQWIMVESGDHCITRIIPRLQKVVSSEDAGGATESAGWTGGGGYRFCRLGETLFDEQGLIRKGVTFAELAAHVFFTETGSPLPTSTVVSSPLIGVCGGTAIYLLFNGVLKDKRPNGGNVLTNAILRDLPPHAGHKVVYGEGCLLHDDKLRRGGITFKQIPYGIKVG